MEKLEYNNSLFSPKGKLNRLFYALHNSFWFLVGFRYIYYPTLLLAIQSSPNFATLINVFSSISQLKGLIPYLSATVEQSPLDLFLKYVFILILRLVDIKRLRDIMGRNLRLIEQAAVIFVFSLPYVDFLSTVFLVFLPADKFSKNEIHEEIRKKDFSEAKREQDLHDLKRLFESGKISRAEYESAMRNLHSKK